MQKSRTPRAEAKLAAKQSNQKQVLEENEEAKRHAIEKTEKLRALRLEKEAADRESTDEAAGKVKPEHLPQPHRQQF